MAKQTVFFIRIAWRVPGKYIYYGRRGRFAYRAELLKPYWGFRTFDTAAKALDGFDLQNADEWAIVEYSWTLVLAVELEES